MTEFNQLRSLYHQNNSDIELTIVEFHDLFPEIPEELKTFYELTKTKKGVVGHFLLQYPSFILSDPKDIEIALKYFSKVLDYDRKHLKEEYLSSCEIVYKKINRFKFQYDEQIGRYRFEDGITGEIVLLTKEMLLEIQAMYSTVGGNLSQIELRNKYKLTEAQWKTIKKGAHLLKRSPVLSDQFIEQMTEEELEDFVSDTSKKVINEYTAEQRVSDAIIRKLKSELQKHMDRLAIKGYIADKMFEKLALTKVPDVPKYEFSLAKTITEPHLLFAPPYDIHFGKWATQFECGYTVNKELTRDIFRSSQKDILDQIQHMNIERVVIPVGSDFFHFDNYQGSTSSGKNIMDTDGNVLELMADGYECFREYVDTFRSYGFPISLMFVPGNHDYVLGFSLYKYLEGLYENCEDVVMINNSAQSCKAFKYGDCFISTEHGLINRSEISDFLSGEFSELWGATKYRYHFDGHLHHHNEIGKQGITIIRVIALSGPDRYHKERGFTRQDQIRGLESFLFNRNSPMRQKICGYPEKKLKQFYKKELSKSGVPFNGQVL